MNVLTWKNLKHALAQVNFFVPSQHEKVLFLWAQFWYKGKEHLPELAAEIAEMDQCQSCQMPEYVIYHECQAREMKYHLICSGCEKTCDGGIYKRDNDYYSFHHPKCGAYVFRKLSGAETEEWYCANCKFALLCGDCGSPHELDINSVKKPEGEDFYLCVSCEEKHCQKCNHWQEDLNQCKSCQELFCSDCGEEDYCRDCQPDTTECLYCGKIVLTEETDSGYCLDCFNDCWECAGCKKFQSPEAEWEKCEDCEERFCRDCVPKGTRVQC